MAYVNFQPAFSLNKLLVATMSFSDINILEILYL